MSNDDKISIPFAKLAEQEVNGIKRSIWLLAGYDLRAHPRNYGTHGAELHFQVERARMVVVWNLFTGWYVKSARRPGSSLAVDGLGYVGYHSDVALYEGQDERSCGLQASGKCYHDGSGFASVELFDKVVENPEELWKELEKQLEECIAQRDEELKNQAKWS